MLVLDARNHVSVYTGVTRLGTLYMDVVRSVQRTFAVPQRSRQQPGAGTLVPAQQSSSHASNSDPNLAVEGTPTNKMALRHLDTLALSPVPDAPSTDDTTPLAVSVGLVHSIDGCGGALFAVQFVSGGTYAAQLPPLAQSTAVRECLRWLTSSLPRSAAATLLTAWYGRRASSTAQYVRDVHEMRMLCDCIAQVCGVPADAVTEPVSDDENCKRLVRSRTGADT